MELLAELTWNADPEIFSIGPVTVRWYGLIFGLGFVLAYLLARRIWGGEGKKVEHLEDLLVLVVIFTIVGARLVHCFVYEPDRYANDLGSVLRVWEGGLASHGGVLGIVIAIAWHSLKHADQPFWWLLDRVAAVACVPAAMVRLGNFVNSEIVGKPTDVAWAVTFPRAPHDSVPRHPAQLYEALLYGVLAFVLWRLYRKFEKQVPRGLLVGILLIGVFGGRFLIEYLKEPQASFDPAGTLTMGQWLSLPAVVIGLWMIATCKKRGPAVTVSEPGSS